MGQRLAILLEQEGITSADAERVGSNVSTVLACLIALSHPVPHEPPPDGYLRVGMDVDCDGGVMRARLDIGLPHSRQLLILQEDPTGQIRRSSE